MRRNWAWAMAAATLVAATLPATAVAADDGGFGVVPYEQTSFNVSGEYLPLVGAADCAGTGMFILWYGPGAAADHLWVEVAVDLDGQLSYAQEPVSVSGVYEPVIGDFDHDGCDDVFWYAPGPAADHIWWGEADATFTSESVTVNGDFEPVVGEFSGALGKDIFWYAPGPGGDYLWTAQPGRSFASAAGPTVNGIYRTARGTDGIYDSIVFHAPGPAQDYVWRDGLSPTGPGASVPVTINGTYEPVDGNYPVLYGPGPAPDYLIHSVQSSPPGLTTMAGSVNGTYTPAVVSPRQRLWVLWHAPGAAADYLWRW